jgi:hypothetical protein
MINSHIYGMINSHIYGMINSHIYGMINSHIYGMINSHIYGIYAYLNALHQQQYTNAHLVIVPHVRFARPLPCGGECVGGTVECMIRIGCVIRPTASLLLLCPSHRLHV